MSENHFADRLTEAIKNKRTPLVVGIDPRVNQLPESLSVDPTSTSAEAVAQQVEVTLAA